MNPEDRSAMEKMLAAGAALYGMRLERPQVDFWWRLCGQKLSLPAFMRAFDQTLSENNRWPKPADVLQAARRTRPEDGGAPRLEAPRADQNHAREAFALIHEITRTRMPPAKRLPRFVAMARRWPGKGWEDAVSQTEAVVVAAQRHEALRQQMERLTKEGA